MREEPSVKTKNAMLEYITELMEDAQNFEWPSVKGSHALLLYRMEEGKREWHMTDEIERLRKAHAQKVVSNPTTFSKKKGTDSQGLPCKFYQNGKCSQKGDHTNNGQLYKHICSNCNSDGKRLVHPAIDCRNAKCDVKKRVRQECRAKYNQRTSKV